MGCLLPEATLQSKHEFLEVHCMPVQKTLLAQPMIRIRILPVMPATKRNPSVRIQARYSGLLSGPRRGRDRILRTGTLRCGGRPGGGAYGNRVVGHIWHA